jgi:hypothetical protein
VASTHSETDARRFSASFCPGLTRIWSWLVFAPIPYDSQRVMRMSIHMY